MAAMKVSEFMLHLHKELMETKKVADSTATAYVRTLYMLNGKKPFKTLTFLKKTEEIEKMLSDYAPNTQKSIFAAVTSVLSLCKDKPTYKKVYTHYYEKMMGSAKAINEAHPDKSEKTEKEKANWVDWEEVIKKKDDLGKAVHDNNKSKLLTPEAFSTLLSYLVLSLYTDVQPRRNQDYVDMWVVQHSKSVNVDDLPTDKNYLVIVGKKPTQFIFNRYKTAKKYGPQHINIPTPLADVITLYLKHHPLAKGNKAKATEFKFLVSADGTPLTATNTITRILNKVFGKKVGSSMLRHSFLSSKYDIHEMEADAAAMGHSVAEQKNYMRGHGTMLLPEMETEAAIPHLYVQELEGMPHHNP
jgi:hypothetical protein